MVEKFAFLFPGQGSQFIGMGKWASDHSSEAQNLLQDADRILGYSLSKIMLEGPDEELKDTANTQPALYVASALAFEILKSKGIQPSFAAGHSLGEYSALYAAGAFSFETGLKLVQERGRAMKNAGLAQPGAMAAIIGLNETTLVALCQESSTPTDLCVPANFNTETQIVISGHKAAVERTCEKAKTAGALKVVMLNVSGAFHSPLMAEAVHLMSNKLTAAAFENTSIPVLTNVDAQPTHDGLSFKTKLAQQIVQPVRWHDTLLKLNELGTTTYIEVGSGKVLGTMAKKLDRKKTVLFTDEFDAIEAFASVAKPTI
jgi:[acyl-carrier-protein] S-malonyltransferase